MLNWCPSKSPKWSFKCCYCNTFTLQPYVFCDTLKACQTLVCDENFLAAIFNILAIKYLVWMVRFQSPLVYIFLLHSIRHIRIIHFSLNASLDVYSQNILFYYIQF